MTYLLDTALLSELVKRQPDPGVTAWIDRCDEGSLFVSVLTLGELRKGVSKLQDSERKAALQSWIMHDLTERFAGRILAVDAAVAMTWGAAQGEAERRGARLPVVDGLIAATALVHGLTVVTRNVGDMERCGAPVINPWQSTTPT